MIEIICYAGGSCGDLITALIDSQGAYLRDKSVAFDPERLRFKKPHTFADDVERDQYLTNVSTKYRSIPSHDMDYHVRRKHSIIGITVQDQDTALWAAERFKRLHRPHVWLEMQTACGANSIEDYAQIMIDFSKLLQQHTDRTVALESIRAGTVLEQLSQLTTLRPASKNFYTNWLDLQRGTFIT
jgi:hypothetical protein